MSESTMMGPTTVGSAKTGPPWTNGSRCERDWMPRRTLVDLVGRCTSPTNAIRFGILAALASGWISFSLPQRSVPGVGGGLDAIAVAKLMVRLALVAFVLIAIGQQHVRSGSSPTSAEWLRRRRRSGQALSALLPWGLFLAWAFLSAVWSPLKSVSIGQSLGLMSMLGLTWLFAVHAGNVAQRERGLLWLNGMLLGYTIFVLACHVVAPESSGLGRDYTLSGSIGIVHPTAAGANASLGVVVAIVIGLARRTRRDRVWAAFTVAIHLVCLIAAQSRAALGMAVVVSLMPIMLYLPAVTIGRTLVAAALASVGWMVIDPGFEILQLALNGVAEFLARGQSASQLRDVSGRAEMWAAVWQQFLSQPWIGHGYFVTSATGRLDVWHAPSNYTAHNIYLQLLVSTGFVGSLLFAWGIVRMMRVVVRRAAIGSDGTPSWLVPVDVVIGRVGLALTLWYAGWTITCVSFLGPIRTESVVFFVLVGLLVAGSLKDESPT